MKRRILSLIMCAALAVVMMTGLNIGITDTAVQPESGTGSLSTQYDDVKAVSAELDSYAAQAKAPKYVFLFIGDGMSHVQINATQVYLGKNISGEVEPGKLSFTQFPVSGVATTYDSTSFCPDSASTATALSCGIKTHSGVLGLGIDKVTKPQSITEKLKAAGYKIGIISSVSIDHATPAAFYAHIDSRSKYYDIAVQMAGSGFDYFAGGSFLQPTGKENDQKSIYDVLKTNGYKVVNTKADILALNKNSGKVYAESPVLQDSKAIPYAIDTKEGDLTLADYVTKGIDVLDNTKGFFMMCESGKIDWACHANDAMSTIQDVVALNDAIDVAIAFAEKHPSETLILVTGDHETGGLTIGYAATGYNTAFNILSKQTMSYVAFDSKIGAMKKENPKLTLEDVLPVIKDSFGLIAPQDPDAAKEENKTMVLSAYEYEKLKNGFAESMKAAADRTKDEQSALLYGTYDPLSVTVTHILNNKAGIGWTSYAHTGTPVPVYASGVGADSFGGSYDNTDIFKKLVAALGLK